MLTSQNFETWNDRNLAGSLHLLGFEDLRPTWRLVSSPSQVANQESVDLICLARYVIVSPSFVY